MIAGLALVSAAQSPAPAPPTPSQALAAAFQNVQTLKTLNPTQLHDAMVFITAALGTNCEACHVRAADGQMAFEKDDKRNKVTARKMIDMVSAINARDFEGNAEITCMTCHQGRLSPNAMPQLAQPLPPGQAQAGTPGGQPGPGGRPKPPTETVDQILAKYIGALGGRDAVAKVSSRTRKGTVTTRAGQSFPVTIEEKAPSLYLASFGSAPPAKQAMGAGGSWAMSGDRTRDLVGVEAWALAAVSDLSLPLDMGARYAAMQARAYDTLDGHDVVIVNGRLSPDVQETFSFERSTGLLLRRVIRFRVSMGRLPMQIDYADYRAVGGVKVPFEVKVTDWAQVSTMKFTDIAMNPALDDGRFVKPAGKNP